MFYEADITSLAPHTNKQTSFNGIPLFFIVLTKFVSTFEPKMNQINTVCTPTLCFFSTHFNNILPSTHMTFHFSLAFRFCSQKCCIKYSFLHLPAQWYNNIVTYRPIAGQWLGKHIHAEEYARNNRTSIARQRISKQAFSIITTLCFLLGPCRGVTKG
jgi:hypothetical protein